MSLDPRIEVEFLASCFQDLNTNRLKILRSSKPEWFKSSPVRWIVERVIYYVKKNNVLPSIELLDIDLAAEKGQGSPEYVEINDVLRALKDRTLTFSNEADDRFKEYVELNYIYDGIIEARERVNKSRPIDGISKAKVLITDIERCSTEAKLLYEERKGYDYFDINNFKNREADRRKQDPNYIRLKIGVEAFDKVVKIVPGTVTGFLAPFKKYKSIILNHFAWAAVLQQQTVALFTLENPLELTVNRLDSRFNFVSYDDLINGKVDDKTNQSMYDFMEYCAQRFPGRLKVFRGSPQKTTVKDCWDMIQQFHPSEFSPDVIIIDYANILAADTGKGKKWEERLEQGQVVWDMQALAKGEFPDSYGNPRQRIVISAWQANMQGVDAERLKRSHIGKSIDIMRAVDNMIGVNQDPQEKQNGIISLSFLAARDSGYDVEEVSFKHKLSMMSIAEESEKLWHDALANSL